MTFTAATRVRLPYGAPAKLNYRRAKLRERAIGLILQSRPFAVPRGTEVNVTKCQVHIY